RGPPLWWPLLFSGVGWRDACSRRELARSRSHNGCRAGYRDRRCYAACTEHLIWFQLSYVGQKPYVLSLRLTQPQAKIRCRRNRSCDERLFGELPASSPSLHQVFTSMETLLVKIFATALALSQVTTAPEAITTQFDRETDQPRVAALLRAGCTHMRKAFDIEDINLDELIATAMDDPQAIGESTAFRGINFADLLTA